MEESIDVIRFYAQKSEAEDYLECLQLVQLKKLDNEFNICCLKSEARTQHGL